MLENLMSAPIWVCQALIWATVFFIYFFIHFIYLFIYFDVSALLDVRHCPKLESCAISTKTNDANSKKMAKNLILDLIYASWALFFNLTSSVNRNHGQLS